MAVKRETSEVRDASVDYVPRAVKSAVPEGYKQTEVGVIPEDWGETTVGTLEPFVTSGSRGWAQYYSKYGDLFIRITNMSRETIHLDLTDVRFVSLINAGQEGIRTGLNEGDVLVSITADIGIISYVDDFVPLPAYINQHIALVRFPKEAVYPKFVALFLAHGQGQKRFRAITDQGAKAGINLRTVRDIPLALPQTIEEQRAIATALSDVDALLEGLDRLIAKKRDLKQAAMQQLLTGQTRLPGFEGEWEVKRLGDLAEMGSGGTPLSSVSAYYDGDIPWVAISDMTKSGKVIENTERNLTALGFSSSAAQMFP
ncbi:MAG: restriction endonuclease subunit S, partial [Gammaproteobacteria bacterium]